MKWCISSIAWTPTEEPAVADLMAAHGFTGVELAPGKLFAGSPLEASDGQIRAVRAFWGSRGISIAAMQALLFGHPELTLFQSADARERTQDYLSYLIALAGRLGAAEANSRFFLSILCTFRAIRPARGSSCR